MAQFKSKSSLVNELRNTIKISTSAALEALDFIYTQQSDDEKLAEHTRHLNCVGFNKPDADVLSSIAKARLRSNVLTDDQLAQVKARMPKYARQIINHRCRTGELRKENGYYNM